ncbi:MAG: competence/damage-inducible protein A [Candidatus Bathyarchaeota archaeon]
MDGSGMRWGGYKIEVVATGDEILFGRIMDTNSGWIAKRAAEVGGRVMRITCVGDDLEEISGFVRRALTRGVDLLVFTGGLGPSEDDLTVEAIGRAVGRRVMLDPVAVERIRRVYEERGIHLTTRGERMARVLEGSRALVNPVGMATGMALTEGRTTLMAFPGIPAEMKAMFNAHAVPLIEEGASSRFVAKTVVAQVVFRDFFPVYRAMQRDYPSVYIKNAATPPEAPEERLRVKEIKVDLVVEGQTWEVSEAMLEDVLGEFHRRLVEVGGRLLPD